MNCACAETTPELALRKMQLSHAVMKKGRFETVWLEVGKNDPVQKAVQT